MTEISFIGEREGVLVMLARVGERWDVDRTGCDGELRGGGLSGVCCACLSAASISLDMPRESINPTRQRDIGVLESESETEMT